MSSSERTRGEAPVRVESPAATAIAPTAPTAPDAYAGWIERMQRGRGRHAAITRNLGSIASYRTWADRMKGSFDDEPKK